MKNGIWFVCEDASSIMEKLKIFNAARVCEVVILSQNIPLAQKDTLKPKYYIIQLVSVDIELCHIYRRVYQKWTNRIESQA